MVDSLLLVTVLLLGSYLLGSIPTGYLLGRWLKGIDIREYGSGSTGATNVLRTLGKGPGLLVLLVDVGKGALAIALIRWVCSPNFALLPPAILSPDWIDWIVISGSLAAILGHSKPLWLSFKGGKSVATSLGILLALDWRIGLATLGVFALVIALSRWVSLSSISAAIALPLLMLGFAQPLPYLLFALVGSGYVIGRHRTNIQRLLAGTEPRVGETAPELSSE